MTDPATIDAVLLNKVSLKYHPVLTTTAGQTALALLDEAAKRHAGQFIFVVEGSVPREAGACLVGERNGKHVTMLDAVLQHAPLARRIVAAGTCASFGGISAAAPNRNGCRSVAAVLTEHGIMPENPVINVPGCPVHPAVLTQTLIDVILTGSPELDKEGRPTRFFGTSIHRLCPRRSAGHAQPGTEGCYIKFGCRGPRSVSQTCPAKGWNGGTSWCIGANSPCIGCSSPDFPPARLLV